MIRSSQILTRQGRGQYRRLVYVLKDEIVTVPRINRERLTSRIDGTLTVAKAPVCRPKAGMWTGFNLEAAE